MMTDGPAMISMVGGIVKAMLPGDDRHGCFFLGAHPRVTNSSVHRSVSQCGAELVRCPVRQRMR
jgi:hypothetical protein